MKKLLLIGLALAVVGCANQRFEVKSGDGASLALDQTQTFWVSGIGQSSSIDAAKVCGGANKVASVETQQDGVDVMLAIVTLGIYSPRQVRISCTK